MLFLKNYYWNYLCGLLDYMEEHNIEDICLEAEIINLRWTIRKSNTIDDFMIRRLMKINRKFEEEIL